MNSTKPRPAPLAAWHRLRMLVYTALPIAGLIVSTSGGARLSTDHALGSGPDQPIESASAEWAVIDRFEPAEVPGTDLAVLLVGSGEAEYLMDASLLPKGASPGVWLRLRPAEGGALSVEIDHERTREARSRTAAKLKELRKRNTP